MTQLASIQGAEDLRRLDGPALGELAREIRTRIIETVSRNGGHLAPNLGVVELTIALLRVFDAAHDRVVWDTGHQVYAWKMLTGRLELFDGLRTYGGISGFVKPEESPCDAFGAGHAGTALSLALGMAAARDRLRENRHVVAVVGDAAIGNGVSLEALNNLAGTARRLIVVLNDNEMSIADNVGSLGRYFGRLLASPHYNRIKTSLERLGLRLRMSPLRGTYHRLEEALKSLVLENVLFEEFGLRYIGPIDGHNVAAVETALSVAREYDRPILVHVNTRKGQGYAPAEKTPENWHSTSAFDISTGVRVTSPRPSWSEVFGRELVDLAAKDSRICAISAGMRDGTGLHSFAEKFPDRFYDVGICEAHAVTFAAGLAASGQRPVVALYSSFLQRAVDGVFHDLCLQGMPVLLMLDRAGLVGDDGPTHHGMLDIPMLRCIPGIIQMQPGDAGELAAMLRSAFGWERTVAIRYPKGEAPEAAGEIEPLAMGRAHVLSGEPGAEAQLWGLGGETSVLARAAAVLAGDGISAGVVNARFIKPLDRELLLRQAAAGTRLFVCLENGAASGGFGSAVGEVLAESGQTAGLLALGWPDRFVAHGCPDRLRRDHGLDEQGIVTRIRQRMAATRGGRAGHAG